MNRFIKVDVNFPDHPKTVELSDRAFRRLVEVWCLSGRTGCDGFLTDAQARRLFAPKVLAELMLVRYVDAVEGGYQMHNFTVHQPSAAVMQDRHEKRVAAGRQGGRAKQAASTRLASAKQTPSKPSSKSVADVDVDVDLETATDVAVKRATPTEPAPDPFDEFWRVYPQSGRKDKISARKAFVRAVKAATPEQIIAGALRYERDPNRDESFTKHASTWLNAGAWENGPLVPRNGRASPSDQARATLELGRRLSAAPDLLELTS